MVDNSGSGPFVWSNGDPVTFLDWAPGEPNDNQPRGGSIWKFVSGPNWFDIWNTDARKYILEVPNAIASCNDADGDGYDDVACGGDDCDDSDPNINPTVDVHLFNGAIDDDFLNAGNWCPDAPGTGSHIYAYKEVIINADCVHNGHPGGIVRYYEGLTINAGETFVDGAPGTSHIYIDKKFENNGTFSSPRWSKGMNASVGTAVNNGYFDVVYHGWSISCAFDNNGTVDYGEGVFYVYGSLDNTDGIITNKSYWSGALAMMNNQPVGGTIQPGHIPGNTSVFRTYINPIEFTGTINIDITGRGNVACNGNPGGSPGNTFDQVSNISNKSITVSGIVNFDLSNASGIVEGDKYQIFNAGSANVNFTGSIGTVTSPYTMTYLENGIFLIGTESGGDGEICGDGIDNNCNGLIDEGCCTDNDNDGVTDCDGDCDDNDPNNYPFNTEVCDGQDNDCDGLVDDDDPDVVGQTTWYADTDGDGAGDPANSVQSCNQPGGYVANSDDLCPEDGNKTEPGTCGCGVADDDSDGDGTEDCIDGCPNDPNKTDPGVCGCGVADVPTTWYADTDGDGAGDPNDSQSGYTCDQPEGYVANSDDLCPEDGNKTEPGQCGCGVADDDSDGDGVADCNDICPGGDDNADADSDGIPDFCDDCPNDPDNDIDNDGVCGDVDNCPADANPGQEDLDVDGIGDVCDATVSVCDAIDALAAYVVSLNLPNNTENFLLNKLNLAKSKYQSGNNNAAIGNLTAFINKVNAKTPSQISPAENAILVGTAQAIIDAINNGNTNCTSGGQNLIAPGNNSISTAAQLKTVQLELFPNPAKNQVNVHLHGLDEAGTLTILDKFGRTVWTQELDAYTHALNLDLPEGRFTSGVYFVSVRTNDQKVVQRLVITR